MGIHNNCEDCPTKEVGFFCSVDADVIHSVHHIKVDKYFKVGEVLYSQGSASNGLYSLRSGIVKLESSSIKGVSNILNILGSGALLGYRSFFTHESHSATAVALEDCHVYFLPGAEVKKIFNCHPELIHKIIAELSKDSKLAEAKWLNQINKTAVARVAEALLFLFEKFNHTNWNRKTIADWSGTTSETVIRSLALFEKEGIIEKNGSKFVILKPEWLYQKSLDC